MGMSSQWVKVSWDIDRTTDTGGDADQYSPLIDLGEPYEQVTIIFPTMTSAGFTIYGQMDASTSTTPTPVYFWGDSDADTDVAQTSKAETTAKILTYYLGGLRYIRVKASANQTTTDKTLYAKGINRLSTV